MPNAWRPAACSHAGAWLRAQVKLHARQADCLHGNMLHSSRRGTACRPVQAACRQGGAVSCKAKGRHRGGCARAAGETGCGCLLLPGGRCCRCRRDRPRRARRRVCCHSCCCIGERGRGGQQAAAASWRGGGADNPRYLSQQVGSWRQLGGLSRAPTPATAAAAAAAGPGTDAEAASQRGLERGCTLRCQPPAVGGCCQRSGRPRRRCCCRACCRCPTAPSTSCKAGGCGQLWAQAGAAVAGNAAVTGTGGARGQLCCLALPQGRHGSPAWRRRGLLQHALQRGHQLQDTGARSGGRCEGSNGRIKIRSISYIQSNHRCKGPLTSLADWSEEPAAGAPGAAYAPEAALECGVACACMSASSLRTYSACRWQHQGAHGGIGGIVGLQGAPELQRHGRWRAGGAAAPTHRRGKGRLQRLGDVAQQFTAAGTLLAA